LVFGGPQWACALGQSDRQCRAGGKRVAAASGSRNELCPKKQYQMFCGVCFSWNSLSPTAADHSERPNQPPLWKQKLALPLTLNI